MIYTEEQIAQIAELLSRSPEAVRLNLERQRLAPDQIQRWLDEASRASLPGWAAVDVGGGPLGTGEALASLESPTRKPVIESEGSGSPLRKRADILRETRAKVRVMRSVFPILRHLPRWRRVVDAFIARAEEKERLPTFKWTARETGMSARQVGRILAKVEEIARNREQNTLDLRKLLRPSEWRQYEASLLRDKREGILMFSDGKRKVEPSPLQGFANLWPVDLSFLRCLCDSFAELALDREGVSEIGQQLGTAIESLLGGGRLARLEAVWAAFVLEHIREEIGGPIRFQITHKLGDEGWERYRAVVIDNVAALCLDVFPSHGRSLNIRPKIRDGEVTHFPAMGRRLAKRVEKLNAADVTSAYRTFRSLLA